MTEPSRRVGFIGLGRMGTALAGRLLDAGYDVTVWSRSAGKADELAVRGATVGETPEDAIATGTVFSMLSDEAAVRQVFTAERMRSAPEGFAHVNHATISPEAAREFAARGGRYLSAPVVGRPEAVVAGNLTVLVSGDADVRAETAPMLAAIGRRVWEFGDAADAAPTAKISVNYLIIHALQALSESITLLQHAGLDAGRFVDMINDSVFPGAVYRGYGDAIAAGAYTPPGFTAALGLKDLKLALDTAGELGVELLSGPVLQDVFATAVDQVGADLDWASIAEVTRRRSGGELR
ncbi:NAD(P)-dependent oxidoreductase [Amycolatopsis rubida]|uniref:NAD(P)-dependent oxidoreductase n=1 Tax=Amycolatopsis rubida TaxID=112413 RepID=A0ABX0C3K5_9PSEU|nr:MULTISPECIES: NAD(P)-dependent oxidoreductase [Amycolatopsis]MYW95823.1 NAD-binding protein [Amycolatopsis rubida]NEC60813.1 NAD(P)-dependent oxidoreductase [Amycolatopsis rubida]OAP26719.1 2-hydroxy-3-oxopropionate reductase [Amycolatopsis sp. M39]